MSGVQRREFVAIELTGSGIEIASALDFPIVGTMSSTGKAAEGAERFADTRPEIERVAPGQFQESASGDRVFFIEKDSKDSQVASNVFIAAKDHGKEAITSARSGRLDMIDNERFLLLSDGQRVESEKGDTNLKISEFGMYGTRIGERVLQRADVVPAATRTTRDLLREPTPLNQGELAWRLGIALAALNLVVIGVAAASVNPRAGRSANLVFALLAFVVYYNLLNLSQSWIAGKKIGFGPLMLALHGGALAIGIAWLTIRHNGWSLRSALPRRGSNIGAKEAGR